MWENSVSSPAIFRSDPKLKMYVAKWEIRCETKMEVDSSFPVPPPHLVRSHLRAGSEKRVTHLTVGLPLLALAQVCFPKGNREFWHVLDKASRQSGAEKHGANHRKSGNNLPRPDIHLPLGDADRTPVLWNAQTFQTLLCLSCLCSLFVSVTSWLPCVKQRCYKWGKRALPLPPARSNPPVTTYEKRLHYELNADILVSSALVTFVSTLLKKKKILHSLAGCQLQRL